MSAVQTASQVLRAGGAGMHSPVGTEGMCLDRIEPPELRIELQPPTERAGRRALLPGTARNRPGRPGMLKRKYTECKLSREEH